MFTPESVIGVEIVAGLFGLIIAVVTSILLVREKRITKELEKELKDYEMKLHVGSEKQLSLYRRAMDEIENYRFILEKVHEKLTDYKNGVRDAGSNDAIEKENNAVFYKFHKQLRFPGVYVPSDIATDIKKIMEEVHSVKCEIYERGKNGNKESRKAEIEKLDSDVSMLESNINNLVCIWKSKLLSKDNIQETIL